jgi:xanthine/uracil permease
LLILKAFLFCAVAVAGMAIIARAPFNRRNRFILTASLAVGFGAILVPNWFSYVFTYKGNNRALMGFFDAIILVMETGFAVTALLAMILNLSIGEEIEQDARELEGEPVSKETEERKSVEDEIIDQEKAIKIEPEHKISAD